MSKEKKIQLGQEFLNGFTDALKEYDVVRVPGLGRFYKRTRQGFWTKHPETKEKIKTDDFKYVTFKAHKRLKDEI